MKTNKTKSELFCHECGRFIGYIEDFAQYAGKLTCTCGTVIIDSSTRAKSTKVKYRGN